MSAIAGLLMLDGSRPPATAMGRLTQALRPFGNDRLRSRTQGPFGLVCGVRVITAEDRLGRLPAREGSTLLGGDCRLDNRRELSDALGLEPARAACLSDSELALKAYLRWGAGFTDRLLGDFALALWDANGAGLMLVRDHTGRRPLYYHCGRGLIAFASSPQILLALPEVPREMDLDHLGRFTMRDYSDTTSSLYKGIEGLAPANHVTFEGGRPVARRYWQFDLQQEIRLGSDQEYVEAFLQEYRRAVTARLRSERGVGCLMSSGLDSTATAALAAESLATDERRLAAYTTVPRADYAARSSARRYEDEGPLASQVAERFSNMDWQAVPRGRLGLMEDMEPLYRLCAYPVRNCGSRMWLQGILAEAEAQGVGVLLDSSAGNSSISWDGAGHPATLLEQGEWLAAAREAWAMHREQRRLKPGVMIGYLLASIGQHRRLDPLRRLWRRVKTPHWQRFTAVNPALARSLEAQQQRSPTDHRDREGMALWWRRRRAARLDGTGINYSTDYFYGLKARHGIEIRDPTADRRLCQFLLSIPTDQYLRKGMDRLLVRRAFAGVLPDEVVWNRRQGRQTPDWALDVLDARADIKAEFDKLSRSPIGRQVQDLERLRKLIDDMPDDPEALRQRPLDYQVILARSASIAGFINWYEQRNQDD